MYTSDDTNDKSRLVNTFSLWTSLMVHRSDKWNLFRFSPNCSTVCPSLVTTEMQRQRKKFEDARELRLLSHYLIPGDVMTTADSATLSSKRLILNPDSQINRFQEHLHLETRRDTLLAPKYKHLLQEDATRLYETLWTRGARKIRAGGV